MSDVDEMARRYPLPEDPKPVHERLAAVRFVELPPPTDAAFAVSPEDVKPVRSGPWLKAGDWKWREFGREVQLRNARLPHLTLDLFRAEAEALVLALAIICAKPMPLPYRTPWHERLRQWWMRRVWARAHYEEQAAARRELIAEQIRQFMPDEEAGA